MELSIQGLNYRRKKESLFGEALKDNKRIFNDLLILYNNNVDVYGKYFDSPVSLIQENEKMKRVIAGYQQTKTYKLGLFFNEIKNFLKSNKS